MQQPPVCGSDPHPPPICRVAISSHARRKFSRCRASISIEPLRALTRIVSGVTIAGLTASAASGRMDNGGNHAANAGRTQRRATRPHGRGCRAAANQLNLRFSQPSTDFNPCTDEFVDSDVKIHIVINGTVNPNNASDTFHLNFSLHGVGRRAELSTEAAKPTTNRSPQALKANEPSPRSSTDSS